MTDVQKIAFDTLKAGAPGLSDQTREVLAGIIARKVALSTTPARAEAQDEGAAGELIKELRLAACGLFNRVMELEHEIRSTPAADEDRVLSVSDDEISVLLEVLAYAGDEVDNATAANSLFVKAEALAALKSEGK